MIGTYFIHMRPKIFAPLFVFAATGYALTPAKPNLSQIASDLLLLFIGYAVLGFGGTCALNSAWDKDEGPVNMLPDPPPVPPYLAVFGVVCMLLSVALFASINRSAAFASSALLLLSVVYSVKLPGCHWRLKEIAFIDNAINAVGCGFISVILGFSIGGAAITAPVLVFATLFTLGSFGSYPASQIFQLKPDDTYATARNTASYLGAQPALRIGAVILAITLLFLCVGSIVFFEPQQRSTPLLLLFALTYLFAIFYLWQWSKQPFAHPKKKHYILGTLLSLTRYLWIAAIW